VGAEGGDLLLEDGGDVERERPRCGQRVEALGQEEVGGDVEEALRCEELAEVFEAL
jgi:hypothetical protein